MDFRAWGRSRGRPRAGRTDERFNLVRRTCRRCWPSAASRRPLEDLDGARDAVLRPDRAPDLRGPPRHPLVGDRLAVGVERHDPFRPHPPCGDSSHGRGESPTEPKSRPCPRTNPSKAECVARRTSVSSGEVGARTRAAGEGGVARRRGAVLQQELVRLPARGLERSLPEPAEGDAGLLRRRRRPGPAGGAVRRPEVGAEDRVRPAPLDGQHRLPLRPRAREADLPRVRDRAPDRRPTARASSSSTGTSGWRRGTPRSSPSAGRGSTST